MSIRALKSSDIFHLPGWGCVRAQSRAHAQERIEEVLRPCLWLTPRLCAEAQVGLTAAWLSVAGMLKQAPMGSQQRLVGCRCLRKSLSSH